MVGQTWATPVDVGGAGAPGCSDGCRAGATLVAIHEVPAALSKPAGAEFQAYYSFGPTGPADTAASDAPLSPAVWLFLAGLVGIVSLSKMRKRSRTNGAITA
jgi:hypothetical protein